MMYKYRLLTSVIVLFSCGTGSNSEGENPGDCTDTIDNDADGQTDCFDAGCALTAECSGGDALAERVAALEAENQSQADQLAELETALGAESENVGEALAESSDRLDALEGEAITLGADLTALKDRVATLESQSGNLVTSVYEVDCNYTTLATVDNLSYCPLVTGVAADNIPMVQFFNNREIEVNWNPQWSCWYSGAFCEYSVDLFRFQSPGMGFRYDEDMETIYAAPHYKASTDPTQTVYTVVVIGDRAYSAP